jgi:hypothetical protein
VPAVLDRALLGGPSTSPLGAMKAAQRFALSALALLPLAGACSPKYPPPPGYVESCYGGDFRANLNGNRPKLIMWVSADEPMWPQLTQTLMTFGMAHDLKYFDTAVKYSGLHMMSVSLCTSKGLWIYADKRIWDQGPRDPFPHQVPVLLYQYGQHYDWEPVSTALEHSFDDWPAAVRSEWPGRDKHGT